MSHDRNVRIVLSEEFGEVLGADGVGLQDKRLTDAIGFLSLWSFNGRAVAVAIYGDRQGELTAAYTDEEGKHVYTIGAVPDDNWNYSFHS